MLDPVEPQTLYPVYDQIYDALREHGLLQNWRGVHDSTLIALDGTWYHSSQSIHCPSCSRMEHANGEITCYHSAVTPVIVAPDKSEVIALRPEFIVPQDGQTKQDCEIAASKRWLQQNAERFCRFANKVPLAEGEDALRALTRYFYFPSWQALLRFMMRGLAIGPYAKPP